MNRIYTVLVILSGFIISSIYLGPQLIHWSKGNKSTVYFVGDELYYAARLARAMQGRWKQGAVYTYENKDKLNAIPPLPEMVMGSIANILNLTPEKMVLVARAVLGALGFWILFWILKLFGLSFQLALFSAFWIFLDPRLSFYKPILSLFYTDLQGLSLFRFSNPLFGLIPFLLSIGFGYKAFRSENYRIKWAIIAGLFFASTFYISFYYWTHLSLIFLAAYLIFRKNNLKPFLVGIGTTVLCAIPYLFWIYHLRQDPNYSLIAWRNGLFVSGSGMDILGAKFFILAILINFSLLWSRLPGLKYLAICSLTGAICFLLPIMFHIRLQNFHWHYTTAPLMTAGIFCAIGYWLKDHVQKIKYSKLLTSITMSILALLVLNSAYINTIQLYSAAIQKRTPEQINSNYSEAWEYLAKNADPEASVLAHPQIQKLTVIKTGLNAWLSHSTELASNQEILDRFQVIWTFQGITGDDLDKLITGDSDLSVWALGVNQELSQWLSDQNWPPASGKVNEKLKKMLILEQDRLTQFDLYQIGQKYRLDYLLRGPKEKNWSDKVDHILDLERIGQFGSVQIDRVLGWKNEK